MTAGLLLAAGQSRRFGPEDKLLARLDGAPLVTYAATALRDAGFAPLIAVVSSEEVAGHLSGFTVVRLADGPAAQSRSLAAGVAEAEAKGAGRLVVALGDMPRVTPHLLRAVEDRCVSGGAAAAHDGTRPMPPAAFERAFFPELRALTGDTGAGSILRRLEPEALLRCDPRRLIDIDTPKDLAGFES